MTDRTALPDGAAARPTGCSTSWLPDVCRCRLRTTRSWARSLRWPTAVDDAPMPELAAPGHDACRLTEARHAHDTSPPCSRSASRCPRPASPPPSPVTRCSRSRPSSRTSTRSATTTRRSPTGFSAVGTGSTAPCARPSAARTSRPGHRRGRPTACTTRTAGLRWQIRLRDDARRDSPNDRSTTNPAAAPGAPGDDTDETPPTVPATSEPPGQTTAPGQTDDTDAPDGNTNGNPDGTGKPHHANNGNDNPGKPETNPGVGAGSTDDPDGCSTDGSADVTTDQQAKPNCPKPRPTHPTRPAPKPPEARRTPRRPRRPWPPLPRGATASTPGARTMGAWI